MTDGKLTDELSNEMDNNNSNISEGLKLVGSYLPTNLPLMYRGKKIKLSTVVDIISDLSINLTQKKIVYWLLLVGFTYPSELRRLYGGGIQYFKHALHSLARKGFVKIASDSPALESRKGFLNADLNTTSLSRKEQITFHELTSDAKKYFQKMKEDIKQDILPHIQKIESEANRYNTVLHQIEENRAKQVEIGRNKKEYADQKEKLSIEVDMLTVEHQKNFPILKEKVILLAMQHPIHKTDILHQLRSLEQIFTGNRGVVKWESAINCAKRNIANRNRP